MVHSLGSKFWTLYPSMNYSWSGICGAVGHNVLRVWCSAAGSGAGMKEHSWSAMIWQPYQCQESVYVGHKIIIDSQTLFLVAFNAVAENI